MRSLIDLLIAIYLWPLRQSRRLALYVKGRMITFEEHYLVALDVIRRKFPNSRGVVFDVGAFDGDSTVYFAKNLPRNKVIGFEPNPVSFARAVANSKTYGTIEMKNIGLSNEKGEMDFYVTGDSVSSSLFNIKTNKEFSFEQKIKIRTATLDEVAEKYDDVLMIKLDVQGAELKVLQGAKNTLKKTKLVLTEVLNVDYYEGACQYFEIDAFLRSNDFTLYTIITNYNHDGIKYFDVLYMNSVYTNHGAQKVEKTRT